MADGNDQPALSGTTLSITVKGPNNWTVVRKFSGRKLLSAEWTLSPDGKSLNDAFTQYFPDGYTLLSVPLPNGSTLVLPYVYERTAGSSGFTGTWDSESATVARGLALEIQTVDSDGLSFKRSDESAPQAIKLDGSDYPDPDPSAVKGGTCSARRVSERSLAITCKLNGQTTSTRKVELSADLKTLTATEQPVGQHKPKSVLVFDRA
jgi:hypothetical protein